MLQQTFQLSKTFLGAGGLSLHFYVLCENEAAAQYPSVPQPHMVQHLSSTSRPSAQGMTKSPFFVRAMRFCLETTKTRWKTRYLGTPWFCLGFKFVKLSLWASF